MKKNTVAFLTRSLIDATGSNMWQGIVNDCRKDDVPVITFRGPILNQGAGSIIYNLIQDDQFAGVISWASSDVTPEAVEYYNRFQKTPLLCMTFHIPGHPVILTDCKTGEKELMNHLIEDHGFRKIAFIRGPALHVYAKERYEGYLEALKEHNIPVDERLISPPGGWAIADGAKAINQFMNDGLTPGIDFEAVVAVGDNVSIGAQEELQHKGFLVPQNVAVCGYNGTYDAACCNPPITTVEMPFFGQGSKAYHTLTDIIEGRQVPDEFRYSTKLVIGESCGCTSLSVKKAFYNNTVDLTEKKSGFFHKNEETDFTTIQRTLQDFNWQRELNEKIKVTVSSNRYSNSEVIHYFGSITPELTKKLVDNIVNISQNRSEFVTCLTNQLAKFIKFSTNLVLWQDILSEYRAAVLPICINSSIVTNIENIFQQSRILVNEIDGRTQKSTSLLETRYESQLRQTSSALLSSYDIPELMNIIAKSLSKLNIPGVYVALYNNCDYTEQNKHTPETSKMILAIHDGKRIEIDGDGYDFPTHDIIPDQFLPESKFYSLVIESLHFQNTFIGYIVFQEGPKSGVAYAALRDQLSSSLYGALILQQLNKNKAVLESTMQTMSQKADIVSDQSSKISGNISTISDSMGSVAQSIKTISGNIDTVANTVNATDGMITEANLSIANLVESTNKIANAVHMINDIAEKTNVLALNASIEAAHAGDAGRGFSVVAKEVKTLAAQTVASTQAIQELVSKNTENTAITEKLINDTNTSIKTIASLSENIRNSIQAQVATSSEISTQLGEATTGSNEISSAISEIAKLGEQLNM